VRPSICFAWQRAMARHPRSQLCLAGRSLALSALLIVANLAWMIASGKPVSAGAPSACAIGTPRESGLRRTWLAFFPEPSSSSRVWR